MNHTLKTLAVLPLIAGCSMGGGDDMATIVISKEAQKAAQVIEEKIQSIDKTNPEEIVWALNQNEVAKVNGTIDQWVAALGDEGIDQSQETTITGKLLGQISGEAKIKLNVDGYSVLTGTEGEGSFDIEGDFSGMGGLFSGSGAIKDAKYVMKGADFFLNFKELNLDIPMAQISDLSITDQASNWFKMATPDMTDADKEMMNMLQAFDLGKFAKDVQTALAEVKWVKPNGEVVEKKNQQWVPVIIDSESLADGFKALALVFVDSGFVPEDEKEGVLAEIEQSYEEIKASDVSIQGDLMFSDKNFPKVFKFEGTAQSEGAATTSVSLVKTLDTTTFAAKATDSEDVVLYEHAHDKSLDFSVVGGDSLLAKLDLTDDNIKGTVTADDQKVLQLNLTGNSKNLKGQIAGFLPSYSYEEDAPEVEWVDFASVTATMEALAGESEDVDVSALDNLYIVDIKEFKNDGIVGEAEMNFDIAGSIEGNTLWLNIDSESETKRAKLKDVKTPTDAKDIMELGMIIQEQLGGGESMSLEEEMMQEDFMEEDVTEEDAQ